MTNIILSYQRNFVSLTIWVFFILEGQIISVWLYKKRNTQSFQSEKKVQFNVHIIIYRR